MPPKEDSSAAFADPVIQTAESSPIKRTQLSDVVMAKSAKPLDEDLWWIHGNGYDLQAFVERHPGGKEAILLGKGRDCTALVESYHAFSPHHGKILEKYLCKQQQQQQHPDLFYDVLKQRAAVALRAKGIDPVQDRGAGWLRMTYYIVIVLLVFATGYLHVKVCRSWTKETESLIDIQKTFSSKKILHITGKCVGFLWICHFWLAYGKSGA